MTTGSETPEPKREEKRVVLVKPRDILLIGNLGEFTQQEMDSVADALNPLGIHGMMFSHNIDLDTISVEELAAFLAVKRLEGMMPR